MEGEVTVSGHRTPEERRERLASEVAQQVGRGGRVESQTDTQAIIVKGRRPNHLLHVILTLVTVGIWGLLVYLPIAIFGGEKRRVITVDTFGNVVTTKGRG